MRKIVFDIETRNIFDDVGKADPALLDISIVGIDTYAFSYLNRVLQNKFYPTIDRSMTF